MKNTRSRNRAKVVTLGGLLVAGTLAIPSVVDASNVRFSDFTPLASSAGPTADEAAPITFGNADFQQRSVADRAAQLAAGEPNSGNWDMITVNETGPHKGGFLFSPFETGQSGIQRHELETGDDRDDLEQPGDRRSRRLRPSFWTPWGTLHHGRGVVVLRARRLHRQPVRPLSSS